MITESVLKAIVYIYCAVHIYSRLIFIYLYLKLARID